jgi:hypothetical protein
LTGGGRQQPAAGSTVILVTCNLQPFILVTCNQAWEPFSDQLFLLADHIIVLHQDQFNAGVVLLL